MSLAKSVVILLLGLCTCCSGQGVEDYEGNDQPVVSARKTQDASILNQIHRHNEDGSYTYGFEGSDGSFKIETKTKTGEVTGKYGYVDDMGKLRVIEYGANKHGFQPSGEGITVPAPTLVELRPEDEDPEAESFPASRPSKRPTSTRQQKPVDGPIRHQPPAQYAAVADFDQDDGWTAQSPQSTGPSMTARSSPSHRSAGARSGWSAGPPPPVSGSFRAAPEAQQPEAPSGSYQSVQQFGSRARSAGRPAATVDSSYQTFEDGQELLTEPPFDRNAKPTGRNGGAGSPRSLPRPTGGSYRTAPRQSRPSGILDQLAEQYALPESGSPVSYSNSYGL